MDKRGFSAHAIIIGVLIILLSILGALIFFQPNFSDEIQAGLEFWKSVRWWILGFLVFVFLWKINFFKAIKLVK